VDKNEMTKVFVGDREVEKTAEKHKRLFVYAGQILFLPMVFWG
jgi:hypothetical protein